MRFASPCGGTPTPEEGAGEPRRRRAPGPRSGGGRGGAATIAGERGARQRGPEAAAADLSVLMEM